MNGAPVSGPDEKPAPLALRSLRTVIIGAGKVGTAVGLLLQQAGVQITAVTAKNPEHAKDAAQVLGARPFVDNAAAARQGTLVLITTGDNAIASVVQDLAAQKAISAGQYVIHMSGALPLSVLTPAAAAGATIGCAHPLQSFASVEHAARAIPGSYFGVTAGPGAQDILHALVDALGGHAVTVPDSAKAIYHAAATVASNYLVAVEDIAMALMTSAGFDDTSALEALYPLMIGTLENVRMYGTTRSLTGPIARGDVATVNAHIEALTTARPDCITLYQLLGLQTLEIAKRRGNLNEETLAQLAQLLTPMLETDEASTRSLPQ